MVLSAGGVDALVKLNASTNTEVLLWFQSINLQLFISYYNIPGAIGGGEGTDRVG